MIRDGKPPLPPSTITELKQTLPTDYGHKLVNSAGNRILAIRIPTARPDMFQDIPRAADFLGTDDTRELTHVLLIGDEKVLRVDPISLRDEVRERTREDQQSVVTLKKKLGRNYEYSVFKPVTGKGSPRLVIRIPKFKAGELDDSDRTQLKGLMAKITADPNVRESRIFYIVTDDDYVKLGTEGFQAMLEGRKNEALATATLSAAAMNAPPPAPSGQYFVADEKKSRPAQGTMGNAFGIDSSSPFGGLMGQTAQANEKLDLHKAAIAEKKAAPVGEFIDGTEKARRTSAAQAPPPRRGGEIIDAESGMAVTPKKGRPQFNADGSVSYVEQAPKPVGAGTIDSLISAVVSSPAQSIHDAHTTEPARTLPPAHEADVEIMPGRNEVATPGTTPRMDWTAPPAATRADTEAPTPEVIVAAPLLAVAQIAPAPVAELPKDPMATMLTKLHGSGYELLDTASLLDVDAAAHKAAGKRILVKRLKTVDVETVQRLERLANDLRADACIVIAEEIAPGTRGWTMGTKVELLRPSDIGELEL
ncbi:MAG: hypothetical protein HY556_08225 [Euryarchaeota archaeon]|nr:hypothetical protein [Euryarchaeota archaeon]